MFLKVTMQKWFRRMFRQKMPRHCNLPIRSFQSRAVLCWYDQEKHFSLWGTFLRKLHCRKAGSYILSALGYTSFSHSKHIVCGYPIYMVKYQCTAHWKTRWVFRFLQQWKTFPRGLTPSCGLASTFRILQRESHLLHFKPIRCPRNLGWHGTYGSSDATSQLSFKLR